MKAGRELDALIAEKVMGAKVVFVENVPHYSTDIAAAWEVVEKLHQLGLVVGVVMDNGTGRYCDIWSIDTERHRVETETTIPHVICLAALKAVQS